MNNLIGDILSLNEVIHQEFESHLKYKADLTREIKDIESQKFIIREKIREIQEYIKTGGIPPKQTENYEELLFTVEKLEKIIPILKIEITQLQDQLAEMKSEGNIIETKIKALKQEKSNHEKQILLVKQQHNKVKRASSKIRNEKERLEKIKLSIQEHEQKKKNLEIFLEKLEIIKDFNESNLSPEIKTSVLEAKGKWEEACRLFNPNNIVPFLVNAHSSYQTVVKILLQLCDIFPRDIYDENFENQIITLMSHGLKLNTRHLSAVESMLDKLEKGVEIAPLASFSNEIKEYYEENLRLLRIVL